jgi:flagellar motor switch/type III secretory pathway protein FliN
VLFDGVAQLEADGARWTVGLALGGFRADALIDPDGRATIVRGWRFDKRKDVTMEADETIDSAAAALAAAPVEVVAELGRITLRGDEVLGLAPGVVLGLRIDRTSAVSLRVGGAIWAEGELVNVDGELGVRVTRTLR